MNEASSAVLMTVLSGGGFGLPGGHVEGGESPDAALRRELAEELGLLEGQYKVVSRQDFWRDARSERIILGYVGILSEDVELSLDPSEVAGTRWVTRDELEGADLVDNTYDQFIKRILDESA